MKLCTGIENPPSFNHEEICYDSEVCPACKALDQLAAAMVNVINKPDECKNFIDVILEFKKENAKIRNELKTLQLSSIKIDSLHQDACQRNQVYDDRVTELESQVEELGGTP